MKIITLKLHNFKGARDLTVNFDGRDTSIYGDNATGKTTIADAFFWLLFGKDSQGKAQFEIKTLNEDGSAVSRLDHSVEGIFRTDDGEEITLKKVYAEKWTKKRGSTKESFTGHETGYWVDDVPKKKGEYQAKVGELTSTEDRFQLLTSPIYFPERLPWQKQRELLLEICGDISDKDVIAANPDLAELPKLMGKKSLDDFKDMITAQRRDINKKINGIPQRIDEANRAIPELQHNDAGPAIAQLKKLNDALEQQREKIAWLKSGGAIETKKLELVNLDTAIGEARNKHVASIDNGPDKELAELRKKRDAVEVDLDSKRHAARRERFFAEEIKQDIAATRSTLLGLGEEWKEAKAAKADIDDFCPTCKQSLPEDQLENARAAFNEEKANKIADIVAEGNERKAKITAMQEEKQGHLSKAEEIDKEVAALEEQLKTLDTELAKPVEVPPLFEETPEYEQLMEDRAGIEKEIADLQAGKKDAIEAAEGEKARIEEDIKANESIVNKIDLANKQRDRIAELEAEEKALSAEYETLEGHLFLVESFIKAKVSMLEGKINTKFDTATFKLFSQQINEGIKETCEVMRNGVPYGSLNSAGRIQVGIEIIKVLAEYYGFYPPVIVDGAESYTSLPEIDAQVIQLVVSGADKSLRVEAAT